MSSSFNTSAALISDEIHRRQTEFGILVDSNSKIIIPNQSSYSRIGQYFNPSKIVTQVLSNPRTLMVTTVMATGEFLQEDPLIWTDSLVDTGLHLNSTLNPVNGYTGPVIIRLIAFPMYSKMNSSNYSNPDGVLVFGDLVNGKVGLNEIAVTAYSSGYAGTYFFNSSSESLVFLSGVYRSDENSQYEYDVDVTDLLLPYMSQMMKLELGDLTFFQTRFRGHHFEFSVIPALPSFFADCLENTVPETSADFNPKIFHVRGKNADQWDLIQKQQLALQVPSIFVQLISSIGISYMLYRPVKKFIDGLQQSPLSGHASRLKLQRSRFCCDCIPMDLIMRSQIEKQGSSNAARTRDPETQQSTK
eukprot:TRINITY_DN25963_c0_g1_i2.p1 TRINITY_DN25963_c0_g1~~TRINITY_DN25963_c0_g1_i2.p1  ORF type:complete len:360 (+),score=76.43 TRINITY_DN25963_c0_g1_i2:125-1204(+)